MSLIRTMVIMAAGFSSVASGAPTKLVIPSVHSSDSIFTSHNALEHREDLANTEVVLSPVSSTGSFLIPADRLAKREASIIPRADLMNPLIPTTSITLDYASEEDEVVILAQVNATMKYPSVLLEECPQTKVDCSQDSVNITFGSLAQFESALGFWPQSEFILFTNHLGDCDIDNERGLYMVDQITFDDESQSVIAATTKQDFEDSTEEIDIVFAKPVAARKRATISKTFTGNFPDSLSLGNNDTNSNSSIPYISVMHPKFEGSIALSGHVKYNMFSSKASVFAFDLDLSLAASANFKLIAGSKTANQSFSFAPGSISVAAFQIPGIISVGPRVQFGVGADVGASNQVVVTAELAANLDDGNVHIDLIHENNTSASGWTPSYTHHANVSGGIDAHINPRLELSATVGAKLLSVLDLYSGIKAKAQLINEFRLKGNAIVTGVNNNSTLGNWNATIPATPVEAGTCPNGLQYTSAFKLGVFTAVSTVYEKEVLSFTKPFGDKCWSWVKPL